MPAFGGLTISARWPLPIGLTRLTRRWLRFFGSLSRLIRLVGVDRRQVVEDRPAAGGLDVDAVDRVDPEQAPVLLLLARGAHGARDAIADAQAEAAHLAGADVDILGARQEAVPAHEAVALVDDVEDAGRVVEAGALRLALEDRVDEVVLAIGGLGVELEVAPDLAQLGDAHLAEIGDVEVVALARGLELLHLVVFGHGGATAASAAHRAAAPRSAIGAHGSLIRSGHRDRVHLRVRDMRGRHDRLGLAHADTCPRADRGGDARSIGPPRGAVNAPAGLPR